jgi:hypothetical protein
MLIGLLVAYLFLGGGHETFLLNPELARNVSTYVMDKNRKKEIDSLIKSVEKKEESFQKRTKKEYDKKLDDLNMNRASTRIEFDSVYNPFYSDLAILQNEYIESELKIRTLIKPDEWEKIMDKVLQQPDKEKIRKRLIDENSKMHDKLLNVCNKHIPDSGGKIQAKALVDENEKKGESVDDAFLDLSYQNLKAIRPYNVTRQDFEPIRKKMLEVRRNYTNDLVDLRFKLLTITPEKEWTGLAKELNEQFNYMGAGISK